MALKRRTPWVYVQAHGLYYRVWDGYLQCIEEDSFGFLNPEDVLTVESEFMDSSDWDNWEANMQAATGWIYGVDYITQWITELPVPVRRELPVYGSDDMLIIPNQ